MAENLTVKIVKIPAWMTKGIDLSSYTEDALDSISNEMHKRQGKGLGAQRNDIVLTRELGARHIESTRRFPRTRGTAWMAHNEGRFRGMAPRAVKKYIVTPLEAAWSA